MAKRHPSLPYILPFGVLLALMALQPWLRPLGLWHQVLVAALLSVALLRFSRKRIDPRPADWSLAVAVGLAVFFIWIAPETLWPGYRQHWLFSNALTGSLNNGLAPGLSQDPAAIAVRVFRAVFLVPVIEELFWRGWLMRWWISPRFEEVPVGAYQPAAFWLTAWLFAAEHGSHWEVGLAAGLFYNWLVIRTKRLGDAIVAHSLTNLVLSLYVIAFRQWSYWP